MLSEDEFEEAFKSPIRNKAPDHDGVDINITSVLNHISHLIKTPLLKIFNESINLGIFLESSKGNTNFQIWQKKITNRLSANFRTFVFL